MIKNWIRNSRMGYISCQSGIMRRMLREEGGWQSHLIKTSEYIQKAVKSQKPKSVRILGSGWLLDIPTKFLIDHCERIILTDIVHPNQIINKYSRYKNIEFESLDITNGIVDHGYKQRKMSYDHDLFVKGIENVNQIEFSEEMIISVNLLSQLNIILTDYLSKKLGLTNRQVIEIAEAIQKRHIGVLPKGKSVLITDYEEEHFDEDDKLIGSKPSVYIPFPKGEERREWRWSFDSKMMYREDCKTILRVAAVRL